MAADYRRDTGLRDAAGFAALDAPRYAVQEFRAETEGAGVGGIVHVHGAEPDPVAETAWLEGMAVEHGGPDGIIGACRLAASDAPEQLRRHARSSHFRGVRDLSVAKELDVRAMAPAMATLAELDLCAELRVPIERFGLLRELADAWPSVRLVLNHGALPPTRTAADLAVWAGAIGQLAGAPNLVCKISTVVGNAQPDWTVETIRPWVLGCVDAFGADRCMLGSNWPLDRPFGTYAAVMGAHREVLAALADDEQHAVLHRTAERTYRLDLRHRC